MRLIARATAALLAIGLVLGGTATAANAQSQTIKDKKADVIHYDGLEDERGTQLSAKESNKSGVDLRSLKAKHSKKNVTVTLKLSRLAKDAYVTIAFRTNGKSQPNYYLINTSRKKGDVYNAKDKRACSVSLKTRYGKNGSVKATIKRKCLGNPKKIRVSASAVKVTGFESADDEPEFHVDVLSKSNVRKEGWTKWLKAS